MTGLQGRCESITGDVVDALAGMAGAAGHAGLTSALTGAAGQGFLAFAEIAAVYRHVSDSLAASAESYTSCERAIAARAEAIFEGLR